MKILILYLLSVAFSFCTKTQDLVEPENQPEYSDTIHNILFIGNSFTFYNNGIDYHLLKMLEDDSPYSINQYHIQKLAQSSYTLEKHYSDTVVINTIKKNNWDYIVLQEQSTRPINNLKAFLEFACKFDSIIKEYKAKTMLFMTWPSKSESENINTLSQSYNIVGSELNASITPVGRIWEYIEMQHPEINLYASDNKHPSPAGTYVSTCAFYYTLFGKNPQNNNYEPLGITKKDIVTIRNIVYTYMSTAYNKTQIK